VVCGLLVIASLTPPDGSTSPPEYVARHLRHLLGSCLSGEEVAHHVGSARCACSHQVLPGSLVTLAVHYPKIHIRFEVGRMSERSYEFRAHAVPAEAPGSKSA